jgi:hypothetical protein
MMSHLPAGRATLFEPGLFAAVQWPKVEPTEETMAEAADLDLYERDFYAWTQDQAARLRAMSGHNAIDVEHLAEEIADLGKRERRAFAHNLMRALQHLVQASVAVAGELETKWLDEVQDHLVHARSLLADSPVLVTKVDVAQLWQDAVREANGKLRRYGDPEFPADRGCPFTLDDLLDTSFDPAAGVRRIRAEFDDAAQGGDGREEPG